MTLKQARIKAKKVALIYRNWASYFNGATQPELEDYLTQVIFETLCEEREFCIRQIRKQIERDRGMHAHTTRVLSKLITLLKRSSQKHSNIS